ncbi:hypothetical protein Si057_01908 [Streptococcus infantarius subsp. infantarius]|nr:hypothetical protein [Streptococcus infantarius subsp. infantarius]MCO4605892.1 hypothetical protein [Streptococcus infantarius subsp. infantarius]MCO4616979.1 hypothetical protein [Streptococcus infantarius subsp. infantarius]
MKDLIGKRYGRLIVVEKTGKKARGKENIYRCQCDCGNTVEVRSGLLSQGRKKSCGCLYRDTRISNMDRLNEAKKYVDGVHVGAFDGRFNKNNTSGFKGVSKHNGGYRAKITVKGHTYYGKTRTTKEEAYKDRLKLEEELLPKRKGK